MAAVSTLDTSRAAASSIKPIASQLRAKVLNVIRLGVDYSCEKGATCDEVEKILRLPHQTVSARVHELMKSGAIVDSGERRLTTSKRKAIVWKAVQK